MLKAVTKRFTDKSTIKQFEFEFYCDCCGKPIKTQVHEFVSGFKDKKFLSFATIRINRTQQMICFSNFDNLSIDMRKELYKLVKESKDELDINHYKVSPFYSGYMSYVAMYDSSYI